MKTLITLIEKTENSYPSIFSFKTRKKFEINKIYFASDNDSYFKILNESQIPNLKKQKIYLIKFLDSNEVQSYYFPK